MEILLADILEDGLHVDGSFPKTIFDLSEDDSIRPEADVHYDGDIYRFEDALVFTGRLYGKFQLQCARCLEYFDFEADFAWSSDLDLEKRQFSFDLKEVVREDFLLELPSSPMCDEMVEGKVCEKAEFIEQVETSDEVEKEPEDDGRDVWGALDDFGKAK
ncbi:DUF177 domain-containing protein [Verrucomicrobiales bacterium]|nr:DUF177 domain-containing protein [Verrucomicrobiales bacterium]MDA7926866.1 DUF177 domain-containing protein [Verrucomicrobiales bacterium]